MAMINFAPRFRGDADRAGPMPARRMQLADALMGRQTPNAMYSKGEGIAHVVDKSLAGFLAGQTERDAMAADLADGELLANVFMPGGSAANPQAAAMGNILAGGEQGSRSMEGSGGFPASLIETESSGRWNALNDEVGAGGVRGHGGRLQFGNARLQDAANAGIIPAGMTPQQFAQQPPEVQMAVENWHFQDIDREIQRRGLDQFIGQNIGGTPATLDGMRAVAHLGGIRGLERFVTSGGRYNPSDSFGTSLSNYFSRHAGNTPSMADMPAPGASPASGQGMMIPGDVQDELGGMDMRRQPGAQPVQPLDAAARVAELEQLGLPADEVQRLGAMLLGQQGTLGEAGIDPRETFFARTGGADSFGLDGPEPFTRGAIPDQNALIGLGPRGGGVAAMEANPLAVPEQPQAMPPMQPPVEVPPAPPVTSVADMPAPQAMPAQAQPPQMMIDPEPYAGDGWIPPDVGRALAAQQMGQPIPPQAMGAALMGGASQPAMAAGMPQQAGGGAMPSQGGGMPMQGGMPAGGAPMPAQPGMGGGDMDAALRQALANPRTRNAAIQILQQRQAQEQQAAQEQAARQARLDAAGARGIDPRMVGDDEAWKAALREDPTSIREYQKAVEQGYPGSFLDFQTTMAEAKRPQHTVNVGARTDEKWGDPESGNVWLRDESGRVIEEPDPSGRGVRPVQVPISGGAVDRDERDRQRQMETAGRTGATTGAIAVREINSLLSDLGYNRETGEFGDPQVMGPRMRQSASGGDGFFSGITRFAMTGTRTGDFVRDLQSLRDTIAVQRLLEIKESGAGLGAVPQQQLEALARALGNLDAGASNERLQTNLLDVLRLYEAVTERSLSDANDPTFRGMVENIGRGAEGSGDAQAGADDDIEEILRRYGVN